MLESKKSIIKRIQCNYKNDKIILNVVGEVSVNEYKNMLTPQFIIKDSEIIG